jgi:UPF0755 protein
MKKVLIPLGVLFLLVILVIGGGLVWYDQMTKPVSVDTTTKQFVITKGSSVTQIADKLEKQGLIKSSLAFRIYTKINNISAKIPPGEFLLSPNLDIAGIIKKFMAGPTQVWVTIPEGLRREQLPQRFVDAFSLQPAQAQTFTTAFLNDTADLEGYLYPDTYLFPKEATSGAVVKRLTQTLQTKNGGSLPSKDILTLASILERETKNITEEGPIVAGILVKRINAGWSLQADATVQYALGTPENWWPTPSKTDLEINSPFNTYKIRGLPPHPIASPGIQAIKAAQNPQTSEYWFYIHDPQGGIHYAKTLEEHNANIAKYLL